MLTSTTITIDGPQSPERMALIETYRKRYNQEMDAPTSVFGAYDSVYLYKLVMERDGVDAARRSAPASRASRPSRA